MASSEEIEAAMRDAIECMEGATDRTYTAALLAARTATLRAHLSRLREEAEFREAAMEWGAWYARTRPSEHNWSEEEARLIRTYRAVRARALEEPRDG